MTTNPIPKQLYLTRWAMKSGATTDLITDHSASDIHAIIRNAMQDNYPFVVIHGVNDKGWPVELVFRHEDLSMWIHVPHEVYLAARPELMH